MSLARPQMTGLPALDGALPTLRLLGNAGFTFAHNISFRGPECFHWEYPPAWQAEYDGHGYAYFDPILLWSVMNTGARRWSEVHLPDLRGVMRAASAHGLRFGASFADNSRARKSILCLARSDREFTDEEMEFLAATFGHIISEIEREDGGGLTVAEIETLRCLCAGMSHAEAAQALGVAVPTVKVRVEKARGKLGARNATQAVATAIRRRLI